jgi:hypothetical protein
MSSKHASNAAIAHSSSFIIDFFLWFLFQNERHVENFLVDPPPPSFELETQLKKNIGFGRAWTIFVGGSLFIASVME